MILIIYLQLLLVCISGLYPNEKPYHSTRVVKSRIAVDSASINSKYLIFSGKTIAANDMPDSIKDYQWYMLAKNEKKKIFLKKIAAPEPGIYSENSLYIGKNWNFSIPDSLSAYFIIGKKDGKLQEYNLAYMFDNITLKVSDLNQKPQLFFFNYKNYYMGITGKRDYKREEDVGELAHHYVITNYRLILIDDSNNFTSEVSPNAKKQVVIEQPFYIYDGLHPLWIGDIDGDDKPDIISPIENSSNGHDIALFLSSEADNKSLVKLVAHYKPCAC